MAAAPKKPRSLRPGDMLKLPASCPSLRLSVSPNWSTNSWAGDMTHPGETLLVLAIKAVPAPGVPYDPWDVSAGLLLGAGGRLLRSDPGGLSGLVNLLVCGSEGTWIHAGGNADDTASSKKQV